MNASAQGGLVEIPCETVRMEGMLELPEQPAGMVLFAHGSGSSRFSPRNNNVARVLQRARLATLLLDLLTPQESMGYQGRFDIVLLARRLQAAAGWLLREDATARLPLGLFGASTGAAAALRVAAAMPDAVKAVVSRGGRPDLSGSETLQRVRAPTLLLVGGLDEGVIELNQWAYALIGCEKQLTIVPGATHLFEEPGKLESVADLACEWFVRHF